jgi:hypothetical protein
MPQSAPSLSAEPLADCMAHVTRLATAMARLGLVFSDDLLQFSYNDISQALHMLRIVPYCRRQITAVRCQGANWGEPNTDDSEDRVLGKLVEYTACLGEFTLGYWTTTFVILALIAMANPDTRLGSTYHRRAD